MFESPDKLTAENCGRSLLIVGDVQNNFFSYTRKESSL